MRKQVFGRKFKRDANERKALLKGLMNELVLREAIKTTEEKAKAIRSQVEKLVTKAKVRGQEARMFLQPYLREEAVRKVIADLAPRFAKRNGGYTRMTKLGERFGDNAKMVVMEWVERSQGSKETKETHETKGETVESTVKADSKEKKSQQTKSPKQPKKEAKTKKETKKTK